MFATPTSAALQRALAAVRIDPLSRREIGEEVLPVGTIVEDAALVLRVAPVAAPSTVTVRVRSADGCVGFAIVDFAGLQRALSKAAE